MFERASSQPRLEKVADRLAAESVRAICSGVEWLDARTIAARTARPLSSAEAQLSAWEGEKRLFSLQKDGVAVYPRYALTEEYQPLPVVSEVLAILGHHRQEWLAGWFESTSAFLAGARPRELLRSKPALVVAAAKDAYEAEEYCG